MSLQSRIESLLLKVKGEVTYTPIKKGVFDKKTEISKTISSDALAAKYQGIVHQLNLEGKNLLNNHIEKLKSQEERRDLIEETQEVTGESITSVYESMYQEMQDNEFTVIDNELETEESLLINLKQRYAEIKEEYEEVCRRVKRHVPIIKFKSTWAYFALLLFIGVCELPLNMVIFQYFGESDIVTMIMAGTVAISVPVLAHFIGTFWKQRSEIKAYTWYSIVLLLLFVGTNIGLGIFRADVLADITATGGVIDEHARLLSMEIFIGLTTILFLIGVIAAYLRHDYSYSLEHAYEQYKVYQKALNQAQKEYDKHFREANEKKNTFIKNIKNDMDKVIENINRPLFVIREELSKTNAQILNIKNEMLQLFNLIQSSYAEVAAELNIEVKPLQNEV